MNTILKTMLALGTVAIVGCNERDPRIAVRHGLRSDTVVDNYVTRPVAAAFSLLIGEGIDIKEAVLITNKAGYRELHVAGYNRAVTNRPFKYRVEWLDANGFVIPSQSEAWLRASAPARGPFSIRAVAPSKDAMDFRMDTAKWE